MSFRADAMIEERLRERWDNWDWARPRMDELLAGPGLFASVVTATMRRTQDYVDRWLGCHEWAAVSEAGARLAKGRATDRDVEIVAASLRAWRHLEPRREPCCAVA